MNSELKLREALHKYDEFDGKNATEQLSKAEKTIEIFRQALAAEPEQSADPEKLELLPISEELLEQLFWEFDAARKQTDERFAFKGKLSWVDAKAKNQKPTKLVRLTTKEVQNLFYKAVAPFDMHKTAEKFAKEIMDAMIKKNGGESV